jgi:hypothetical protein
MLLNVAKERSGPYSSPNSRFASSFASSNSCRKCIGVPCLRNEYNNDKNTNDNDELKQQLLIQLPNSQIDRQCARKTTVQTRRQKKIETDERPKQKCFHAAAPCQARGQRLQEKTVSFSSALSRIICLSRACLGKLMAFSYINDFIHKWLYIKRPFSFTASLSGSSGRNSRNVPFASPSHSVGWRLLSGLSGLHAHIH